MQLFLYACVYTVERNTAHVLDPVNGEKVMTLSQFCGFDTCLGILIRTIDTWSSEIDFLNSTSCQVYMTLTKQLRSIDPLQLC